MTSEERALRSELLTVDIDRETAYGDLWDAQLAVTQLTAETAALDTRRAELRERLAAAEVWATADEGVSR